MAVTSKNLVLLFHVWLVCQNVVAQTLVGIAANPGGPPNSLVSIDPNSCDVSTIAAFSSNGKELFYVYDNAGWVDSDGYYYANFLTGDNLWAPGTTYTFDLNSPGSWSNFGQTAFVGFAESPSGDVYGVGTAGEIQVIGVSVSAESQSETTVGQFTPNYGPSAEGCSTVDGNGIFWSWFDDPQDYDYWLGMDISSGNVQYSSRMYGGYPLAIDIHYDASNQDFFSICRVGNSNYMMCKVDPTSDNSIPKSYGTNVTVQQLMTGGVFSTSNRILYVQFFINPSYEYANLIGFNVDSGEEVSNCEIPTSVGGALLNMAVF